MHAHLHTTRLLTRALRVHIAHHEDWIHAIDQATHVKLATFLKQHYQDSSLNQVVLYIHGIHTNVYSTQYIHTNIHPSIHNTSNKLTVNVLFI